MMLYTSCYDCGSQLGLTNISSPFQPAKVTPAGRQQQGSPRPRYSTRSRSHTERPIDAPIFFQFMVPVKCQIATPPQGQFPTPASPLTTSADPAADSASSPPPAVSAPEQTP